MAKQPESFEKSLTRLEAIVARLERGELPLEESLTLYEEGVALVKGCTHRLDEAERRVERLVTSASGEETTVPLDPEG
ncbi:MAG: exodeoxyribonuclease VII small subunit [Nitrospirae bacterium CG18_big_fil_WC_8_21_14_2_50_70_55]|nr:exodeoxyribonuclease VII small subunit [Deltaproteobacteria bacterium]OIP65626.1 MAG: exodeoxyribonuclease VII small subunit [Nitrospirae bacterium CG2_30_70_394]PIQ07314.1 MAG: exodeoxyribonuclease VII small subunit [Nitrospirae bacterium CG18_big_fil_WC_8_21_14_2_50_70_55]PIU80254.1 MAG: exodeoxyribonuclease VII small subunit [Nitrospirae bacterium CG06_land_8_20_14_3_00_70_43]PIW82710.1 MAG: exodeoxyribonuclease VII small subunit [Nitrospirae bacterium CG_4_8_14_3_um_filter_70_85]PIX8308